MLAKSCAPHTAAENSSESCLDRDLRATYDTSFTISSSLNHHDEQDIHYISGDSALTLHTCSKYTFSVPLQLSSRSFSKLKLPREFKV